MLTPLTACALSRRILHRDLKSKNIFIRHGVLKVGDFGIAKVLVGTMDEVSGGTRLVFCLRTDTRGLTCPCRDDYRPLRCGPDHLPHHGHPPLKASTFAGTPYYMSPECLKSKGYNSKSDIWALGCLLYEMCCLRQPFQGESLMGLMYKICEGERPELPPDYDQSIR